MGAHPDATINCGGSLYVFRGSQAASPDIEFTGPLYYAVSGGRLDDTVEHIRGERDVFRAWSNLRTALLQTTGHAVKQTQNARRRIKRAVR
jgi:hypothetical protein